MKLSRSWQVRLAQGLLGAALVTGLVVVSATNAENEPFHATTDWSHRHLIFSTPKTLFERIQFSSNHRYVQQWVRRYAEKAETEDDREAWRWRRAEPESMKGDWSMKGKLAQAREVEASFALKERGSADGKSLKVFGEINEIPFGVEPLNPSERAENCGYG